MTEFSLSTQHFTIFYLPINFVSLSQNVLQNSSYQPRSILFLITLCIKSSVISLICSMFSRTTTYNIILFTNPALYYFQYSVFRTILSFLKFMTDFFLSTQHHIFLFLIYGPSLSISSMFS